MNDNLSDPDLGNQEFKDLSSIRDLVSNLTKNLDEKEKFHAIVHNALQNPDDLNSENKHDMLMKIVSQRNDLAQVLKYTSKLLG